MNTYTVIFSVITAAGAVNLGLQLYRLAALDAKLRGMKRPGIAAVTVLGGQRGEGLIVYLLGRRKYQISMTDDDRAVMKSRKAKCIFSLIFLAVSAVCAIIAMAVSA